MNTEQIMYLLAVRDSCSYDASLALEANKALQAAIEALVQERDALNGTLEVEKKASAYWVNEHRLMTVIRNEYQVEADKLAAENKVLRDAYEPQIKLLQAEIDRLDVENKVLRDALAKAKENDDWNSSPDNPKNY